MKCTVEKDLLLAHLQKVCNVIDRKSTLPILGNLLVKAENDTLTLTATNLEIRIDTTMKAVVVQNGSTTIPARNLLALAAKFKGSEITFDCNKQFHTKLKCGNSEFNLLGLNPDEFPEVFAFGAVRKLRLKQAELTRMIDSVSYAVCADDARKVLQGVLVSVKNGVMAMVATDGKRLAIIEREPEFSDTDGDIVLPLKTALEVKRLLGKEGTVDLEIGERGICIQIGTTVILSKLIDGSYPNFRQVIPTQLSREATLRSNEMIPSLELFAVPLGADNGNVTLTFRHNELELFTQSNSIGDGKDNLDIVYADEEEFKIMFNLQFLAAPFKFTGKESLHIKMNDSAQPILLEDGDFRYIIMPMRQK